MPNPPKKRRRAVMAAAVANATGAAAGFTAHALGVDPDTSMTIGTIVAGAVGDVLLQYVANSDDPAVEPARTDEPASIEPAEAVEPVEAGNALEAASEIRPHEHRRGHRGYARCARPTAAPVVVVQPAPSRPPAGMPRHAGHRHLHRGAQRFVRRVHGRDAGSQEVKGRRGAS
ncbi:hypothetical protein [Streptomyces sp. NBC_01546]|uniref:hypothetical protein n=1 Tax=Streptomyces sp. NBC_01546 TaxID=2975872 RepID=UPI002F917B25